MTQLQGLNPDHSRGVKIVAAEQMTMKPEGREIGMRQYRILRTWSVVLAVLGVVCSVSMAAGVIWLALAVDGGWQTAAVIAIGAPVVLLVAMWPLVLGHALRALADIGDDMAFESLTTRASSPY